MDKKVAFLIFLLLSSCGKDKTQTIIIDRNKAFDSFKSISSAPEVIKNAAKAVVKLNNGTASFVRYSDKIFLMTNYHVIGRDDCPLNGCIQEVTFNWQDDVSINDIHLKILRLKPYSYSQKFDVVLFEFEDIRDSSWTPSHFLEFNSSIKIKELIGSTIHIVGHPALALKKWSTGTVISSENSIISSNVIGYVGGSSGSPLLDENGNVVAIHHSSIGGEEILTATGMYKQSFHTPVEKILETFDEKSNLVNDMNNHFTKLKIEDIDLDYFLKNHKLYTSARIVPFLKDGKFLEVTLIDKCVQDLNSIDLDRMPKDLAEYQNLISSCLAADRFIHCELKIGLPGWCMQPFSLNMWNDIYQRISEHIDYYSSSSSMYFQVRTIKKKNILDSLKNDELRKLFVKKIKEGEKVSFFMVNELIDTSTTSSSFYLEDIDIKDFVLNYKNKRDYIFNIPLIINSVYKLWIDNHIEVEKLRSIVKDLKNDSYVNLRTLFLIEQFEYVINQKK